jgi:hypothetical protein
MSTFGVADMRHGDQLMQVKKTDTVKVDLMLNSKLANAFG